MPASPAWDVLVESIDGGAGHGPLTYHGATVHVSAE